MNVYIDAHTHNTNSKNPFAIRNLKFDELCIFEKIEQKNYYSVGIHPWDIHKISSDWMEECEKIAENNRIVAIGECGLDKNCKSTIKEQVYFLERQILISEKLQKPMILHCVAAFNELISIRKRMKPLQDWMIHGFRGKPQMAEQLLKAGFALSYGEFYNPESIEKTPIEKLCIETDISLKPIEKIYKEIAYIKNCMAEELNASCKLFKLFVCK